MEGVAILLLPVVVIVLLMILTNYLLLGLEIVITFVRSATRRRF